MKNQLLLFGFIVLFIKINAQSWSLVWSDEFNGSKLDILNWTYDIGGSGWGNNELEYYTNLDSNSTLKNGNLLIIAKEENYNGKNYTSARLKTQGLQSWTFGKIEASMKLPYGKGFWPAFWMLGENINQLSWPGCGEIDIMEHINSENAVYATVHWDNNGYAKYGGSISCNASQYHVYSIEWNSQSIKWFLDGTQYWEGNIANYINHTEEFHLPFFIILNLAIGGDWPGNPDSTTTFPDTMFVDYVRVYQELTTKINENDINNPMFQLLLNPVESALKIIIEEERMPIELSIYNLQGEQIMKQWIKNSEANISVATLPSGIYFVKVTNDNNSKLQKIMKK